jgi:hypothetical protein
MASTVAPTDGGRPRYLFSEGEVREWEAYVAACSTRGEIAQQSARLASAVRLGCLTPEGEARVRAAITLRFDALRGDA